MTVCGFNQTETKDRVSFLACLDGRDAASDDKVTSTNVALNAGKHCASASNVDASQLETCYNGDQGEDLLKAASAIWNKQFPSRATVPHTFVDTTDVQPEYSELKDALCKAGSTSRACSSAQKTELCSI